MATLDIIINAENRATPTFREVKNALGDINNAAQELNKISFSVGDAIKNSIDFGVRAAGIGLATLAGAMTATAAKGIADFAALEKGMNEVFTLLPGISQKAMDAMTDDLQDLNQEFGLLSSESVPALYQAISAGVPADNVFSFLETAQKAAVGGVTDLHIAVDGITSVVNAYGADVMDATKASDLMFAAVKLGKTDFEQLSGSLFNVIPTAAALGVNFGDVTAALAGMTAQGTPTSVATTQLRQLLVELSKEGTKVSDAFKEMTGKTFQEFIAEGNNLQDALNVIAGGFTETSDNSEKAAEKTQKIRERIGELQQQLELAVVKQGEFNENTKTSTRLANENRISDLTKSIFDLESELANTNVTTTTTNTKMTDLFGSVEASNAALALTGKGAETFTRNINEMGVSAGATEKAYDQMDQGIGRSIEKISASLGTMLEQVGEKLAPVFEDLLKWIQTNMPTFSDIVVGIFDEVAKFAKENLPEALTTLQGGFDNLSENVVPFTRDVLGKLQDAFIYIKDVIAPLVTDSFPKFLDSMRSMWEASEPLRELIGKMANAFSDLDAKQIEFIAKAAAIVLAIGPVVSAISGIISIFTGAAGLVSAVTTVISFISGAAGIIPALGAILNPVGLAVAAVAGLGIAWATDFGGIRTKTIEITGQVGQTISKWSADTVSKFQETQGKIGVTLAAWSNNIGTTLATISTNTGTTLATWSNNTVSKFRETQTQIGTTLAGWSTSLGSTLSNLSSQTGSTLNTWATEVVQRFNTLRNDSQNAFSGMSSSIQSSATNLAAQALISLRRLETEGVPIFSKFRENAVNKIGEMVGDVPRRLRELVDAGLRVFDVGKWIQAGADVIGGVLRGLQNAATAPLRWIENFASGLIGLFTSKLKIASPSQVFDEFGVNIMEGLQGGLEDRSGAVLGFMNQFSRDLVETSAAAQRLADAEFKKLTDSATAAYNGFVATANNIATLSQNIDQAAIAAQNAAQQAYVDSLAPAAPAADSGFGTGRVSDLTRQITDIVQTSFRQVGSTGIQSLGINLAQFANVGQIQNAIAQLSLLAGTIQQNAQNAPAAQDRARLESLYSDVSRRILPLLQTELQRQSAAQAEAAQLAAAEMASRREAAQPFFTQLAESVSRFAGETWSGVNRIVFSQSGWANLAQEAKDAVLGIIQQGQQGLVQQEGVADAVNTLRNVTVDTDQTRVAEALGRLVEFRSWFNSLIDASGFGEQIRAANNGSAGFTAARSQGSSIINNFNLAYSTLQSSQSVMSDVEYLNALYGAI